MPNRAERTRFLCRWVPRRRKPRVFDVPDAARVCCDVVRHGRGTFRDIQSHFDRTCNAVSRRSQDEREQSAAVASEAQVLQVLAEGARGGASTLEANTRLLDVVQNDYILFQQLVDAALLAISIIPIGRIAQTFRLITRRTSVSQVAGRVATMKAQQAANDNRALQLRQAANDALFRINIGAR